MKKTDTRATFQAEQGTIGITMKSDDSWRKVTVLTVRFKNGLEIEDLR
jgi:hypothetical protein